MRSAWRRTAALAGVLVVVGALAGCVSIPASGSVVPGPAVDKAVSGEFDFRPEGPAAGASQEDILRGFVAAFTGPKNDYKVAREFLTPALSGKWDPRSSVLVRVGGFSFTPVSPTAMDYSFQTLAAVDASGSYTELPSPSSQTLTYAFSKVGKEWRISQAPGGIVLSEGTFAIVFSPQTLYFLDPSLQRLVPDRRWFSSGTAATRIVNALLAGPPPWLQHGAVTSVFPDGTQLTSPKVVLVNSGVAKVDLSSEALSAKDRERQLMRLQLTASLSGLSSIRGVTITVDGSPYPISDSGSDLPEVHPQLDNRAVVLRGGQFGYYANGKVTPINGLSAAVLSAAPRAAAVDIAAGNAAVLGAAGAYAVRSGATEATLVDDRPGLIAPALDPYGFVWSVPADDPTAIRVFGPDGKAHDVAPALPRDSRVASLEVSTDGARVAVLLDTDAGSRLIVAAVLRDPDQRVPTALGAPILDTTTGVGDAIDVTWLDELSVATLTTVGDGQTGDGAASAVTRYEIGGMRSSLGQPGPALQIVGGNGTDDLRVLDSGRLIQVPRGNSWSSTGVSVDFIAIQL